MRYEFITELKHGEEISIDLTFPPDNKDDVRVRENGDGTISIGYITHDDHAGDFWADRDEGELKIFRTERDRDAWIDEQARQGRTALVVDNYSHSGDHYSLQGTRDYPDRRWDVAPRGAYVLGEADQETWNAAMKEGDRAAALAAVTEAVNVTLDEYSKWANGEVYGHVIETFERDGAEWAALEELRDDCWGYIGSTYALERLDEAMGEDPSSKVERLRDLRAQLARAAEALEDCPDEAGIARHDRLENILGDFVEKLGHEFDEIDAAAIRADRFEEWTKGVVNVRFEDYARLTGIDFDPEMADRALRIYPGNLVIGGSVDDGWRTVLGNILSDDGDNMEADRFEALEPALFDWGVKNGYLDLDAPIGGVFLAPAPEAETDEPDGP